jgi:GNAT superfamily N-acetyltransferase
VKANFAFE